MSWLNDPLRAIPRIISALRGLQARSRNGWVPWATLARKLTGSDRLIPLIKAMTAQPQFEEYFRGNDDVVRLTPAGLAAQALPPATVHWGETIGLFVRRYAAELDRESIAVADCLFRTPVSGGKFLHGLAVAAEDIAFATETPVLFRRQAGGPSGDG